MEAKLVGEAWDDEGMEPATIKIAKKIDTSFRPAIVSVLDMVEELLQYIQRVYAFMQGSWSVRSSGFIDIICSDCFGLVGLCIYLLEVEELRLAITWFLYGPSPIV